MNRFIRQKLAEIEKNQRSDYRLGYSFEPKGLSIAPKTLANFLERKTQPPAPENKLTVFMVYDLNCLITSSN